MEKYVQIMFKISPENYENNIMYLKRILYLGKYENVLKSNSKYNNQIITNSFRGNLFEKITYKNFKII